MSIWLVLAIVLVLGILLLEVFGGRPVKYRKLTTPELRELLEVVYVRGKHGGYLEVASDLDATHVLRVYKRIVAVDQIELDIRIPESLVHRQGDERLEAAVAGHGTQGFTHLPHKSADWLTVDSTDRIDRAVVLIERLAEAFLNLDLVSDGVAHAIGVHGDLRAHPGLSVWPR